MLPGPIQPGKYYTNASSGQADFKNLGSGITKPSSPLPNGNYRIAIKAAFENDQEGMMGAIHYRQDIRSVKEFDFK